MTLKQAFDYYDVESVWHFTDLSNISSIVKYGLLSLREIEAQQIDVSRYGADRLSHRLDRRRGLDTFVHLAFMMDHPMYHIAKHRGSIVRGMWIELPVSVVLQDDVRFCNEVANKFGSKLYTQYDIANNISFNDMFYGADFHTKKEARKAEILVPNKIDASQIIGVYDGK